MDKANGVRLFRIAGWCGILAPFLTVVAVYISIISSSWFSWTGSALSDLGVSYPSAYYFNSYLIFAGVLALVFGRGLYHYLPNNRLPKSGALLFLIGAAALLFIGIFTSDTGLMHGVVSAGFFSFSMIAIILIGISELRSPHRTGFMTIILGLAAITMFVFPWPGYGIALNEVSSIIFMMGFIFMYGMRLLLTKRENI